VLLARQRLELLVGGTRPAGRADGDPAGRPPPTAPIPTTIGVTAAAISVPCSQNSGTTTAATGRATGNQQRLDGEAHVATGPLAAHGASR
jgi:hypothetical protein